MAAHAMAKDSTFCLRIPWPNYWTNPNTLQFPNFNLFNLTLNGISAIAYALISVAGEIVGNASGTSAFLSCIIAVVVSLFPGACIIELSTKFPSAGSIYTYTYATIGESFAFLVGMNLIFDVICQAAFTSKEASLLIDKWTMSPEAFANSSHSFNFTGEDIFITFFDPTPDWKAGLLILVIGAALIFWVRISASIINSLTVIFLVSLLAIIITCFVHGNASNLTSTAGSIFKDGFPGVLQGAAMATYLYSFYDVYSTSAEESNEPHSNVPRAALIGTITVTMVLFLSTLALAFLVPNHLITSRFAFLSGFEVLKVTWAASFLHIVSFVGMIVSASVAIFVPSRYLLAIARDGLLPSFIAYVQPLFKTPVVSITIVTLLSFIMAMFLNAPTLVSISKFGCALLFFVVGLNLIIFRYMPFCALDCDIRSTLHYRPLISRILKDSNGDSWMKKPLFFTILLSTGIVSVIFAGIVFRVSPRAFNSLLVYSSGSAFSLLALIIFIVLSIYNPNPIPSDNEGITVPFLPVAPILSIVLGIILAMDLPAVCWGRFIVISSFALVLYFIQYLVNLVRERRKEYETISESSDQNKSTLSRGSVRKTL